MPGYTVEQIILHNVSKTYTIPPSIELSNSFGALGDAALSIIGDSKNRLQVTVDEKYCRYLQYSVDVLKLQNPFEALQLTREIFNKLKKKVDILGDVSLQLTLENTFAAFNEIEHVFDCDEHEAESATYLAIAQKKMKNAEEKAMKAFYQSLTDEKALILENVEKTTISIQVAIFFKILIPSFRLDKRDICIFHCLEQSDKRRIANNLKDLVDNLIRIQSQLKSKRLLPANGTMRENAGKFQWMVDFVLKITYPYFTWTDDKRNDPYDTDILTGNHPLEKLREKIYIFLIMPKYLGRGRAAGCEVTIGQCDDRLDELEVLKGSIWGEETVTIKLWRGESAIIGTAIPNPFWLEEESKKVCPDKVCEEELVLYREFDDENKKIEVKVTDLLNHKWQAKPTKLIPKSVEAEDSQSEEQDILKARPITLVPKDFPTWREDSLPINIGPLLPLEHPLAVAKVVKQDSKGGDGEDMVEDQPDDDVEDEDKLDPQLLQQVILNIWRGNMALFGTVGGVLVFIQPFSDLSEEISLDIQTLRRHNDWEDLTKEEITPGVNVDLRYLGVGYEARCPIILGDFPKHKEDILTKKENEDNHEKDDEGKKDDEFWSGFLYSECPQLVVEIWQEDECIFGIIRGTDNVVIKFATENLETKNLLNLTLKQSLERKPQSLGDYVRVSSSAKDCGNPQVACGIYAKKGDQLYCKIKSFWKSGLDLGCVIEYNEHTKWVIKLVVLDTMAITYNIMRNTSEYPSPPVTGWRIGGLEEAGWKPAPQINVISLGQKEMQPPEEVLAGTYISIPVRRLGQNKESKLPFDLEIAEDDVSAIQKALDYTFWAGWMAGRSRKLELEMWTQNGFVIGTYRGTDDVVFHQCLGHNQQEIIVNFEELRHRPIKLGELVFVNSTGAANQNLMVGCFENPLGVYELQKFTLNDRPVFKRQKPIATMDSTDPTYVYIAVVADDVWTISASPLDSDNIEPYNEYDRKRVLRNRLTFLRCTASCNDPVPTLPPTQGWSFAYSDQVEDLTKNVWKEDPVLRIVY